MSRRHQLLVASGLAPALLLAACSLFTDFDSLHDPSAADPEDDGGGGAGDGNSDGNIPPNNSTEGGDAGGGALVGHALILFGGERNDGGSNISAKSVATAVLSDDGGIGEWTETALEGAEYAFHQVASVGSSVYAPREPLSFIGTIDSNKNVGWTIGTSPKRYDFCTASSGDSIFLIGGKGENGDFTREVTMAAVGNSSATQLTWKATTALPVERNLHGCAASDKYAYLGGGKNAAGMHQANVFVAEHVANGLAAWKETTPIPFTTYWPRFVVAANRLVLVGGEHDTVDRNSVYHAKIQADGTLGAWQIGTNLPASRYGLGVSAIGNRIYVSGGGDNTARTEVYTATIDEGTGVMSTWTPLTPLPLGRQNHGSAIVTIP